MVAGWRELYLEDDHVSRSFPLKKFYIVLFYPQKW